MARQLLTKKNTLGPYPATPLVASSADLVFTPAGATFADGSSFDMTGDDLLIVHNGNAAPQTVTIDSMVDGMNRKGDISAYSLAAGEYAVFEFTQLPGWAQSNGRLNFAASAADVEFAVVHLARR
jgi:hypothetical protein